MNNLFSLSMHHRLLAYSISGVLKRSNITKIWTLILYIFSAKSNFKSLLFKIKKVKVSNSLIAIGVVGVRAHCIFGTADKRRIPSLSFRCLNLP